MFGSDVVRALPGRHTPQAVHALAVAEVDAAGFALRRAGAAVVAACTTADLARLETAQTALTQAVLGMRIANGQLAKAVALRMGAPWRPGRGDHVIVLNPDFGPVHGRVDYAGDGEVTVTGPQVDSRAWSFTVADDKVADLLVSA